MWSCTMSVPDPGGLGATPAEEADCPKENRRALYNIASIYGNGLRWFGGGLRCFNRPFDGYANS